MNRALTARSVCSELWPAWPWMSPGMMLHLSRQLVADDDPVQLMFLCGSPEKVNPAKKISFLLDQNFNSDHESPSEFLTILHLSLRPKEELEFCKAQYLALLYQRWGSMFPSERTDFNLSTCKTVRSFGSPRHYVVRSLIPQDPLAVIPNMPRWMKQI